MPIYIYSVLDSNGDKTGEAVERHFRVNEKPDRITLDDGRAAEYDFAKTIAGVGTTPPGAWPRTSESLGVHKNQVQHFRKKYPDHGYNADGTVTLRSPEHARRVAEDRGAIDMN